ncbi:MAG: holo-ACP synthase [Planctomycetota bacterium]
MILGLGTDVVGVGRMRQVLTRHRDRFLGQWFDQREAAHICAVGDIAERAAGRWAAKEAAAKALGTGFALGVVPSQIVILPGPAGVPQLVFLGKALARVQTLGSTHWHVSISHADGVAVAVVILE